MFDLVFGRFISTIFNEAAIALPQSTKEKLNEEIREFFECEPGDGIEFEGGDIYWYLLTLSKEVPPISKHALAYCVLAATKIYLRELMYANRLEGLKCLLPMALIGAEFYVEHSDKDERKEKIIQAKYLIRQMDSSSLSSFRTAFYHSLIGLKSASHDELKSEMASILRDPIVYSYLTDESRSLIQTY